MPYFATFTGRKIDLTTISENDICLEDIAHHLTQIQRYGGALPFGTVYSVAEHSLHVADYLSKRTDLETIRWGLMHDAAEAYIGDLITGLKGLVPEYKVIEKKLEEMICNKYEIRTDEYTVKEVKRIDTRIVLDEIIGLIPEKYSIYKAQPHLTNEKPLGILISGLCKPEFIKQLFLDTCKNLHIED